MKKRFDEQQTIAILKEAEVGIPARELCRKNGISDATFYTWRKNTRNWMSLKPVALRLWKMRTLGSKRRACLLVGIQRT